VLQTCIITAILNSNYSVTESHCASNAYLTICIKQTNSRSVKSQIGQLADWTIHAPVKSPKCLTGNLEYQIKSTQGLFNVAAVNILMTQNDANEQTKSKQKEKNIHM